MSTKAEDLRREAERWRRAAGALPDGEARRTIEQLAAEYDARADAAEAAPADPSQDPPAAP